MTEKTRKAQVIVCKCGAKFAACVEPFCYTEKEWQKDLRKYVNEGCTVEIINCSDFSLESCTCNKKAIKPDLFIAPDTDCMGNCFTDSDSGL